MGRIATVLLVLVLAACAQPGQSGNRGLALLAAKDYAGAQAYFQSKLAADPDNPYHLLNLGVTHERQGRLAEARANFTRAQAVGQNAPILKTVTDGLVEDKTTTVAALAAHNLARIAP